MGRSIKKGPFVQAALMKHVEAMNASGKKQGIKTWSRASPNSLVTPLPSTMAASMCLCT